MIALHKNGLDAFSALCYFFAMILPALQAIVEQQLFYSRVIGAVKADDAPPVAPARPHPFQIPGRDLGQNTMRR